MKTQITEGVALEGQVSTWKSACTLFWKKFKLNNLFKSSVRDESIEQNLFYVRDNDVHNITSQFIAHNTNNNNNITKQYE